MTGYDGFSLHAPHHMHRMAETEGRRPHAHPPIYRLRRDALAKTASESILAIVRERRILFTGFVFKHVWGKSVCHTQHLYMWQQREEGAWVMFGELVGGVRAILALRGAREGLDGAPRLKKEDMYIIQNENTLQL